MSEPPREAPRHSLSHIVSDPNIQDTSSFSELLEPVSTDLLEAYEVSTYVNSPKNQGVTVIEPVVVQATLAF